MIHFPSRSRRRSRKPAIHTSREGSAREAPASGDDDKPPSGEEAPFQLWASTPCAAPAWYAFVPFVFISLIAPR